MPITRTPIIDDDSTGTTGTIINNAWKQEFYDQIDGLGASGGVGVSYVSNADVGTQNNWTITGRGRNTLVAWTGASALVVNGIAGGALGDQLTIRNQSASVMYFNHQAAAGPTGSKLNLCVTSGATPVAPAGFVTLTFNGAAWVLISHEQGASIAFSLTDVSGAGLGVLGGGTYFVVGRQVFLSAQPIFPATANGAAANVGGFPYVSAAINGGFYQVYGVQRLWYMVPSTSSVIPMNPTTGAQYANSAMSGSNNVITGFYQIP